MMTRLVWEPRVPKGRPCSQLLPHHRPAGLHSQAQLQVCVAALLPCRHPTWQLFLS